MDIGKQKVRNPAVGSADAEPTGRLIRQRFYCIEKAVAAVTGKHCAFRAAVARENIAATI